jgi:prepilin-type N-terminal cleavage/methylation domain-containing protein
MHKYHSHRANHAFTLVELLIVIVVIAILASISVVAYNGIRQRAESSVIVTQVKHYATILEMYIQDHGRAPKANWRCLGDATTLPATGGYEEGFCFSPAGNHNGSNTGTSAPADPVLMAELESYYGGKLPNARFPEARGVSGRMYRGVVYDGSTNNFANYPAVIVYYIKGQTCPIGDKVDWWTSTMPTESSGCVYRLSVNENGVRQ